MVEPNEVFLDTSGQIYDNYAQRLPDNEMSHNFYIRNRRIFTPLGNNPKKSEFVLLPISTPEKHYFAYLPDLKHDKYITESNGKRYTISKTFFEKFPNVPQPAKDVIIEYTLDNNSNFNSHFNSSVGNEPTRILDNNTNVTQKTPAYFPIGVDPQQAIRNFRNERLIRKASIGSVAGNESHFKVKHTLNSERNRRGGRKTKRSTKRNKRSKRGKTRRS
uniref:Uncharacterized protein n=1 Tax=viral metagenome TaxID=1070528 RepID=A0A6C0HJD4_9ZZZZ